MDDKITISPAHQGHAAVLARVHKETFPGLLSTRLGSDYLTRLYAGIIGSSRSACFIAENGDRLAGFICGTCDRTAAGHAGAFLPLFGGVLRGDVRIAELPDVVGYARWMGAVPQKAELQSLVVVPDQRQHGVGKMLVDALIGYFRKSGVAEFCVFSDNLVSTGIGFYRKIGFTTETEYDHGGFKTVCLRYTIP